MKAIYNDSDRACCAWINQLCKRGLIPDGEITSESVRYLSVETLARYTNVHLFAGIGGWAYALRLAGWPDDRPVWTGSCPCQPYSSAGKRKGHKDSRDLWSEMLRLMRERRPSVAFGEQVASSEVVGTGLEAAFVVAVQAGDFARANKLAKRLVASKDFHFHQRWIDRIHTDLEREGYTLRFKVLGAHSVGAPHIRQRLFWVADRAGGGRGERGDAALARSRGHADGGIEAGGLSDAERGGLEGGDEPEWGSGSPRKDGGGDAAERMGSPIRSGLEGHAGDGIDGLEPGRVGTDADGPVAEAGGAGPWSGYVIVPCGDGKSRRLEPGLAPLAHGVPARVVRLRGYGNAIVPQVAAEFVRAYMETRA